MRGRRGALGTLQTVVTGLYNCAHLPSGSLLHTLQNDVTIAYDRILTFLGTVLVCMCRRQRPWRQRGPALALGVSFSGPLHADPRRERGAILSAGGFENLSQFLKVLITSRAQQKNEHLSVLNRDHPDDCTEMGRCPRN